MNYTESTTADVRAEKPLETSDNGDLSLVEAVAERTGLQKSTLREISEAFATGIHPQTYRS